VVPVDGLQAHADTGILVRLEAPIIVDGIMRQYFVANARYLGASMEDIDAGVVVDCGLTWISEERAQSERPLDVSWWRGGLALLATVRGYPF